MSMYVKLLTDGDIVTYDARKLKHKILDHEQNKLFDNVISINMNFGTRRVKGDNNFGSPLHHTFARSLDWTCERPVVGSRAV